MSREDGIEEVIRGIVSQKAEREDISIIEDLQSRANIIHCKLLTNRH